MQIRRKRRHGAILAAALVCLLLVILYTGAVAQALVLRQRASQSDERQLQCFWLVQSAMARAAARCQADPTYRGESWRIPVTDRGRTVEATVEIQVQPDSNDAARRHLHIQARLPDDPLRRVQRQRELTVGAES